VDDRVALADRGGRALDILPVGDVAPLVLGPELVRDRPEYIAIQRSTAARAERVAAILA